MIYQKIHEQVNTLIKKQQGEKVFCIGYVKTGTSSLYKALRIMGYRTVRVFDNGRLLTHDWGTYLSRIQQLEDHHWKPYIRRMGRSKYDAFVDFPLWYSDVFKEIDKSFPKSKFILTIRDTKGFLKSYQYYFQGSPWEVKNTKDLKQIGVAFEQHNQEVMSHFNDDPSRLLILDVVKGEGWKELCSFLQKPVPRKPFPYRNKGRYKKDATS